MEWLEVVAGCYGFEAGSTTFVSHFYVNLLQYCVHCFVTMLIALSMYMSVEVQFSLNVHK